MHSANEFDRTLCELTQFLISYKSVDSVNVRLDENSIDLSWRIPSNPWRLLMSPWILRLG
jgi:hypothetical protein